MLRFGGRPAGRLRIDGRIEVSGAAKFIIAANAWLNAKGGIHLPAGKKLTVCGSGPDDCVKTTLSAAMNLVMMTEGTGQGVNGRRTNVSRLYDLLVENGNQRLNLEAGPGTHAFRHFGGTFFGTDAMSIVNHHQNWFLNHAPRTGALKIFLFGFSRGALIMRVVADWLCQRGFPVEYMGLWDTVDSTVGIKGEDYIELPSNVKFARHAVARDEFRRFFNYLPLREGNREEGTGNRVEEVVFPGCHSDVGGFYDDNHAIADTTLYWILEPALKRGLKTLHCTPTPTTYAYKIHDSLHEPTNGWGLLEPVKRALEGVKRHSLCDII